MSPSPPPLNDDEAWAAAELALGLLDGQARLHAEQRSASDPAFSAEVEAWRDRLAALVEDASPAQPAPELWEKILAGIGSAEVVPLAPARVARDAERLTLQRRLAIWRAAALAGLAASLVMGSYIAFGQDRAPAPAGPIMVARLTPTSGASPYLASFDPGARRALIVLPARVAPDGRSAQLWAIGADGKPVSIGLARSGGAAVLVVPVALARRLRPDVVMAVSVEPLGGSSTGRPTGPVVAKGPLAAI